MPTKKKFNWPEGVSLEKPIPVYIRFRTFDAYGSYVDTNIVVEASTN